MPYIQCMGDEIMGSLSAETHTAGVLDQQHGRSTRGFHGKRASSIYELIT
jgi:hypothetical protein